MFKFDKFYSDKIFKYTLFFLFFSLINIFIACFFKDIYVFLIRETMMCFFLLLHYFYSDEFALSFQEDEHIRFVLEKKYPILKFESALSVGFFLGSIVFFNLSAYPDCAMICLLALLICYVYIALVFYSVFCILRTPEVRSFYNIKRLISKHGIRSFATFSKVVINVCKGCALGGFIGVTGVCILPRIAEGDIAFRGETWNTITYQYTGKKADSDWDMARSNQLLNSYPEDRALIMKEDGCTIDPVLLKKQMQARSINYPPVDVTLNHTHKIGGFWSSSSKDK